MPGSMAVDPDQLEIIHYPDPVLLKKAQPVEQINDEVRAVVERMFELMFEAHGVGLAAPQVGLNWRLFITSYTSEENDRHVFINPTLSEPSRASEVVEEGCLSLPGVHAKVRRPKGIVIEATDLDGSLVKLASEEFPARVWQHEFDHLEGVLILDKMGGLDKRANKRVVRQLEADYHGG